MMTDHQVTEQDAPEPQRELGIIVTAVILIATLATVAWLVAR
jgi:hypothetical protein